MPFPAATGIPLIDIAADTGLYMSAILLNLDATLNQRIAASGGYYTPQQIVDAYQEVTGNEAKAITGIGFEKWSQFLPPAMKSEMVGNFQLIENPGYYVGEPADAVEKGHELLAKSGLRKPHTFKEFLQNMKA
jgi:hypothetical protein